MKSQESNIVHVNCNLRNCYKISEIKKILKNQTEYKVRSKTNLGFNPKICNIDFGVLLYQNTKKNLNELLYSKIGG